jgi:hypothetical protein
MEAEASEPETQRINKVQLEQDEEEPRRIPVARMYSGSHVYKSMSLLALYTANVVLPNVAVRSRMRLHFT